MKAGVVATAGVTAAGVVIAGTQVFGPGDPSPVALRTPAVPRGALAAQQPLPAGTSIVQRRLVLPAGAAPIGAVQLSCPSPLRVADLLPASGPVSVRVAYARRTVVGSSHSAQISLTAPARTEATSVTVAILCRRATPAGSIRAADQREPGVPTDRVSVREALLRERPGGAATGSVRLDQPVRLVRRSGDWSRVVTDAGRVGWVPSAVLQKLPAGG